MSTTEELIEQYKQKRQKILEMGGNAAIEKRHQAGQMSARERIDYLFDAGTFTEIGPVSYTHLTLPTILLV